jgi:hypothetical protein
MSRLGDIEARLDQGMMPTEAEVRALLAEFKAQSRTLRTLTQAAIDFLDAWLEATPAPAGEQLHLGERPQGWFDPHGGQFVDA